MGDNGVNIWSGRILKFFLSELLEHKLQQLAWRTFWS